MIKNMVMENTTGLMGRYFRVLLSMARDKDKE
jgi:hypothetical protein